VHVEDGHADDEQQRERLGRWLARRAGHSSASSLTAWTATWFGSTSKRCPRTPSKSSKPSTTLTPAATRSGTTTTWSKQDRRHVPAPRPDSTHIDVVATGERFRAAANLVGEGVLPIVQEYSDAQRYDGG
jgi:hypothetical protein